MKDTKYTIRLRWPDGREIEEYVTGEEELVSFLRQFLGDNPEFVCPESMCYLWKDGVLL
ncbi:MAG: hypothetical protein ACRD24_10765 [Terriglobales bacterium]